MRVLLGTVLLFGRVLGDCVEDASVVLGRRMATELQGSSVVLQSSTELRPAVEAGLRRAGLRLASDGLTVLTEKSDTPGGPILAMRLQTSQRTAVFVEPCNDLREGEQILSARPLMTHPRSVLDVKKIGELWFVLEPDRLLTLDGLGAGATLRETRAVSGSIRRDPRGYIVPGEPVAVRMEEQPGGVSITDCDGKQRPVPALLQRDGEVTFNMQEARPLSLPGTLTAMNQFDSREVLVTLRHSREEVYTIWLVSVSCVR